MAPDSFYSLAACQNGDCRGRMLIQGELRLVVVDAGGGCERKWEEG